MPQTATASSSILHSFMALLLGYWQNLFFARWKFTRLIIIIMRWPFIKIYDRAQPIATIWVIAFCNKMRSSKVVSKAELKIT
jgi:hypothetical protein